MHSGRCQSAERGRRSHVRRHNPKIEQEGERTCRGAVHACRGREGDPRGCEEVEPEPAVPMVGQRRLGQADQAGRGPRGGGRGRHHGRAPIREYSRLRRLHGLPDPRHQSSKPVVQRVLGGGVRLPPQKGTERANPNHPERHNALLPPQPQINLRKGLRARVQSPIRGGRGVRVRVGPPQPPEGRVFQTQGSLPLHGQLRPWRLL